MDVDSNQKQAIKHWLRIPSSWQCNGVAAASNSCSKVNKQKFIGNLATVSEASKCSRSGVVCERNK